MLRDVRWCFLFVVQSIACCLSVAVRGVIPVVRCSLFVACRLLWYLCSVLRCVVFVVCCSWFAVLCLLRVGRCVFVV